jgi:ankyrin repeat protein
MGLLLDKGSDINNGVKTKVWTPLHMAAGSGKTDAIKLLLGRNPPADINAWASDVGTSLTLAIFAQNADSVRTLLEHHADVKIATPEGNTAFAIASEVGNLEILNLVWKAGGQQYPESKEYGCSLAAAAYSENLAVVKRVLEVDNRAASGQKALEVAAKEGSQEIVDFLLQHFRGLKCEQAFAEASLQAPKQLLESLWAYSGHSITKATLDKCLYQATDNEQKEKVKSLLEMGASPNARGDEYVSKLFLNCISSAIQNSTNGF